MKSLDAGRYLKHLNSPIMTSEMLWNLNSKNEYTKIDDWLKMHVSNWFKLAVAYNLSVKKQKTKKIFKKKRMNFFEKERENESKMTSIKS